MAPTGSFLGVPEPLTRRRFLAGVVASAVAAACTGNGGDGDDAGGDGKPTASTRRRSTTTGSVPDLPADVFALGVASGDPLPSSVILWTRLAPRPLDGGGMPDDDVPVRWEVATDEAFDDVVADGVETATAALGHSVHADAAGLAPDRWYHYRFTAGSQVSPVGRTRTTPTATAEVDRLRFVFASCQNWKDGYWPAWRHAAEEEADLVVFLGDYIYESGIAGGQGVRRHNSEEVTTLAAYRDRYGLYKGDPNLQTAHRAAPWVTIWDDHEVENNYAGEFPQDGAPVGPFADRRVAAYQAYYEHQPMRIPPPDGGPFDLYRTLDWGRLARFHLLDGRQFRTDQPCGDEDLTRDCPERADPNGTMLGKDQEVWLGQALSASKATWNVLANQVIMTPLPLGPFFNMDQWDGYPAARSRLLDQITSSGAANPVVITGDIHASGVGDVSAGAEDDPVVAAELVGTSISSDFPEALADAAEAVIGGLPQVKWFNVRERGYVTCEVTAEDLTARFRVVTTTREPEADVVTRSTWVVDAGTPGAREG